MTSIFGTQSDNQSRPGSLFASTTTAGQSTGLFGSSQPQQTGSLFGSSQPQQSTSLFGFSQPQQTNSLFGSSQPQQTSSLFGSSQPQQTGGLFRSSQPQQTSGLFASSQPQHTSSLFGSSQPQQTSSLFGPGPLQHGQQNPNLFSSLQPQQTLGTLSASDSQGAGLPTLFGSSQPQQTGGLFASSQPQQTSGLFGSSQPQPTTSLFNAPHTGYTDLWGNPLPGPLTAPNPNTQKPLPLNNQPPQANSLFSRPAPTNLFGGSTQNQQPANSGLFGTSTNQQQQQQPQQIGSILGQSQGSRIWNEQNIQPRQKSIPEQIALVSQKWDPNSPSSLFQTYLYNHFPEDISPFFRPDPNDSEEKWEEALRKAPTPRSVPFSVRGFQQLGQRILVQEHHLRLMQGRLNEINQGLEMLLRRHDLEISTRAAECRRRHVRLGQKALVLATKTQVLRNRGYVLDAAEEELKRRLLALEKRVLDPEIEGRGEEIWARMVGIKERGRMLEEEFRRAGRGLGGGEGDAGKLDEGTVKKAKKVLEDYDNMLTHLSKELAQVRADFEAWEKPEEAEKKRKAKEEEEKEKKKKEGSSGT